MKILVLLLAMTSLGLAACPDGHPSVENEFTKSELVATVQVIGSKHIPAPSNGEFNDGTYYKLRLIDGLKGNPPATFTVFDENDSGRFDMDMHRKYVIFVYESPEKRLRINSCGNSGLLHDSGRTLKIARKLSNKETK
jgi:hypothetical protein